MTTDRRNPYKPFDPSLIQDFLQGREVLSADLLLSGRSNTNYKLVLRGGGTYILRLRAAGTGSTESYVLGLVKDIIPVPEEIHRSESWSVYSYLEGELLERSPHHSAKAAAALARISSVAFDSTGWINGDGTISPFLFGGVTGYVREKLDDPRVQDWIGAETGGAISRVLIQEKRRLEALEGESRLVHGDFNPSNILIADGMVSGILDWEYCHSGSPYMDIGNLIRHTSPEYHGHIKAGLQEAGMSLPDDWKERAELMDLTSNLEFLTSARSDGFKRSCVDRIQHFLRKFHRVR